MFVKIRKKEGCEDIPLPKYQTYGSSGMDLYASIEGEWDIKRGQIGIVPTGIHIALPYGYEGQVRPRSGLASKFGITLVNSPATIDSDFRGEIKVPLINLGKENFTIRRGSRIAQLVVQPVTTITWVRVPVLDETYRNVNGFGHTGGV